MPTIRADIESCRQTLAAHGDDAWASPLWMRPGTPEALGPRDDLYFADHPRRQYRLRNITAGERVTFGQGRHLVVVRRSGTKVAVPGGPYLDREADAASLFAAG